MTLSELLDELNGIDPETRDAIVCCIPLKPFCQYFTFDRLGNLAPCLSPPFQYLPYMLLPGLDAKSLAYIAAGFLLSAYLICRALRNHATVTVIVPAMIRLSSSISISPPRVVMVVTPSVASRTVTVSMPTNCCPTLICPSSSCEE